MRIHVIFITPSTICLNMLTFTCSLHTYVPFMQNSTCKYFLQIAMTCVFALTCIPYKVLFSMLNLWDYMQKIINSTWIVYAHSRLDFVFRCVSSMVEWLSLILSTEVSMLITYFNMELKIVNKLSCSINMLLLLIAIT